MATGWTRVATAVNAGEAGMMEGLLKEAEIPVLIQGGDMYAGPQSVMVPDERREKARQILEDTIGLD